MENDWKVKRTHNSSVIYPSISNCIRPSFYLFIAYVYLYTAQQHHHQHHFYPFTHFSSRIIKYSLCMYLWMYIPWMINAIFLLSPVSTPYSYFLYIAHIKQHIFIAIVIFMFTFIIRIRNYYLSFMKWTLNGNWCHCEALEH